MEPGKKKTALKASLPINGAALRVGPKKNHPPEKTV